MTTNLFLYVLDADGKPLPCDDIATWGDWFERTRLTRECVIAQDCDEGPNGTDTSVSTVFLGIDHGFGVGRPVLWETMVFGGQLDGLQRRYTSREAALAGHRDVCLQVIARWRPEYRRES